MAERLIEIEFAYAAADRQVLFSISVPTGTTLAEALVLQEVRNQLSGLDLPRMPVGIFGRVVDEPDLHVLESGERVEIYRPLMADPKEIRRLRAAKAVADRTGTKKPG